jgi:hypothetical protein
MNGNLKGGPAIVLGQEARQDLVLPQRKLSARQTFSSAVDAESATLQVTTPPKRVSRPS